jgi:hypothetical protein
MAVLYVDGKRLKRQIQASARWLLANEETLNRLNVFPVPDGDTGTNMGLTMKAVVQAISEADLGNDLPHVAATMADSALMGARGNSGVILSQIFKGFAEGIGSRKRATAMDIAYSLKKACEKAYEAVAEPTEGTILTVVREGVEAAYEKARTEDDIITIIATLLQACRESLARTPNLLPILREANVVDAGAMGFVCIIEGIHRLLTGAELPAISPESPATETRLIRERSFFGYCTEFFVQTTPTNLPALKAALMPLGNSLVLAASSGQVKIHIHTERPGLILEACREWGLLTEIKIDNMDQQHADSIPTPDPEKTAVIAVAMGEGLHRILTSLGCTLVVPGGQTMNPSVRELSSGIDQVTARTGSRAFVILPNNGNVLFSAQQLAGLHPDKKIAVVPTRTVPEGLSALMAFDPEGEFDRNVENMRRAAKRVKTGEVTTAVKTYQSGDLAVHPGDTIAIFEDRIIGTFPDAGNAAIHLVKTMSSESDEIISLFSGEHISEEAAKTLEMELVATYPHLEVERHHGGQPHYAYIVSIE